MSISDLKVETRLGKRHTPCRILSIVSNTVQLKGFPVGFFAEEMTRTFLMFIEAGHPVDLASPKGGEVMFDIHSAPRTPDGAYANDLISLDFVHHTTSGAMLKNTLSICTLNVADDDAVWGAAGGGGPVLTFRDDKALHKQADSRFLREGQDRHTDLPRFCTTAVDMPVQWTAAGRGQKVDGYYQ